VNRVSTPTANPIVFLFVCGFRDRIRLESPALAGILFSAPVRDETSLSVRS
jgi:hypothetical protein